MGPLARIRFKRLEELSILGGTAVVLDVKKKPETDLFGTILNSRPEKPEERIEALNELASRQQFQNPTAVFHGIIAVAKLYGISSPEGTMLSELLSKVMGDDKALLELFLTDFVNQNKNRYFVGFAARFVKNLKPTQKSKAIPSLVSVLLEQDSLDLPAELLTDTLTTFRDEQLSAQATAEVLPKALSAKAFQVFLAVRVLSKIAGADATKNMLTVVNRTLTGWYGQFNDQIQDQVLSFFARCPSEETLPIIRQLVVLRPTGNLMQVFGSFRLRAAAELLQDMIEQSSGDDPNRIVDWCAMALDRMEPEFIDIPRLVSSDAIFQPYWNAKFYVKRILMRTKSDVKPILFKLLKSSNPDRYAFAADCLSELGVSLDEMSTMFEESPSSELYRFFYPKETASEIWKNGEAKSLGSPIGKGPKRFEFFLIEVLSSLNFQVLYVDSANKPGVDIVALSPSGNHLVIAGTTVESLKDDVGKLRVTLEEMREKMKLLMDRSDVLSIVLSASKRPATDEEMKYARQAGIVVLGRTDVEKMLQMSSTGRTSQELVAFLKERKLALSALPNPFESRL